VIRKELCVDSNALLRVVLESGGTDGLAEHFTRAMSVGKEGTAQARPFRSSAHRPLSHVAALRVPCSCLQCCSAIMEACDCCKDLFHPNHPPPISNNRQAMPTTRST
jgi:hypothetical protein